MMVNDGDHCNPSTQPMGAPVAILRKHDYPFTIVANVVLTDPGLSFKAKGLYAYMRSKPDGWQFAAARIAEETKEGRDAIRSAMGELKDAGFIEVSKERADDGTFTTFVALVDKSFGKSATGNGFSGPGEAGPLVRKTKQEASSSSSSTVTRVAAHDDDDDDEIKDKCRQAAEMAARRKLRDRVEAKGGISDDKAWIAKAVAGIKADHGQAMLTAASRGATVDQLAVIAMGQKPGPVLAKYEPEPPPDRLPPEVFKARIAEGRAALKAHRKGGGQN